MKKFKSMAMLASMLISIGIAILSGAIVLAVKSTIHFWPYVALTLTVTLVLTIAVMLMCPWLDWWQ